MPANTAIVVIRNPVAGQRKGPFVDAVVAALVTAGADVSCIYTDRAGHAEEIARDLVGRKDKPLVVASGGDGTIREVACGLYGSTLPLGLIPAGTANVLARELGYIKNGTLNAALTADILLGAKDRQLYPFEVQQAGETRLGICWVGAGFDAETLIHVKPSWKNRIGRAAFVPAVLTALFREGRRAPVKWRAADMSGQCGWGVVANIQRYAGPFTLTRRTEIDQVGVSCLMFSGLGMWPRIVEQAQIGFSPLDKRAASFLLTDGEISLGGDDTPVQLDGDFAGYGPVKIRPLHRALRVRAGPTG